MATLTTRPSNNPSIFSRGYFSSFDMSDIREEDFFPYSLGTQEMQQNFADLGQSTYDSYAPQPAYTFIGEPFYQTPHFVLDGPKDNIQMQYEQSTSPSVPSLVQSLDQVPSNLSHTSGASGPSTASSAVGSPYSQAAHSLSGQEQWLDHQGLGIDPTMDPDFTLPCQDIDLFSPYDGKFSGGFGESRKLSSSSSYVSCSPVLSSPISYSPRTSVSAASSFSSPVLALDPSTGRRHMTLDTIVEEFTNNHHRNPNYMSSPSVTSASPLALSPAMAHLGQVTDSPSPDKTRFKSPTIPASAMAHPHPPSRSSSLSRRSESRKRSYAPAEEGSGSEGYPVAKRPTPPPPSGHPHGSQFPSPFFSQSSGRFVPPLQSSCWFSLRYLLCFFIAFSYISFPFHVIGQLHFVAKIC
jgi:hypothetical protein